MSKTSYNCITNGMYRFRLKTCLMICGLSLSCQTRSASTDDDAQVVNSEATVKNAPTGLVTKSTIAIVSDHSFCSGSIIKLNRVITAKHCIDSLNAENYQVFFGTSFLKPVATIRGKGRVAIHPSVDLAVFELSQNIPDSFLVAPIHDPQKSDSTRMLIPQKTEVVVVGFGHTSQSQQTPEKINFMRWGFLVFDDFSKEVESTSGEVFQNLLNFVPRKSGKQTMFCQGDSGGPIYLKYNQVWGLLAINSMTAEGCTSRGFSGDVRPLKNWIFQPL